MEKLRYIRLRPHHAGSLKQKNRQGENNDYAQTTVASCNNVCKYSCMQMGGGAKTDFSVKSKSNQTCKQNVLLKMSPSQVVFCFRYEVVL